MAPGRPLRSLVDSDALRSVILWGPPGVGKTTLARVAATGTKRTFVTLSAVTAGVKDVRAVIDAARRRLGEAGVGTILFLDEIHRFNRAQQDALLPAVEDGSIVLIGATTENPYFSIVTPLLSRALLFRLEPLDDADIAALCDRALHDPRGIAGAVALDDDARTHLVARAAGDARRLLNGLDVAASLAQADGRATVGLADAEAATDAEFVAYDRNGDGHYDVASAFIKSLRGSDPDAACYWLARMLAAGEDPRFVARRMIVFASEDVGLADPQALVVAVAAAQALESVGLPEARLNLAHAALHLARAPKSNSVIVAIDDAAAAVRDGPADAVPPHLRDAHYGGAAALGHGTGYVYPHDEPGHWAPQRYLPERLDGTRFHVPSGQGDDVDVVPGTGLPAVDGPP